MTPLAIAYLPFALVLGAAVAHSPDPMAGWAATLPPYGGSAHLACWRRCPPGRRRPPRRRWRC